MEDPIKYKIKNSHYYKFEGIAPDGFKLIPNKTFERLLDFDNWKEWKTNPEILEKWMIEDTTDK
jgi:hypothetical protein